MKNTQPQGGAGGLISRKARSGSLGAVSGHPRLKSADNNSRVMFAVAYRSGRIRFTRSMDRHKGALLIAMGKPGPLRRIVTALARMGYTKNLLLVPGIPEAPTEWAGIQALRIFRKLVKERLERRAH